MKFTGRCLIGFVGRRMLGLLSLLGVLGLTPGIVAAQILPVEAINDHYLIETNYDKAQAYTGNTLSLKIALKSAENRPVPSDKVLKLARCDAPDESPIEAELAENHESTTRDSYNQEIYTCQIKIPEDTEPRAYRVKLRFQYEADSQLKPPRLTTVDREVGLFVGERTNKRLVITGGDSVTLEEGSSVIYNLSLQNNYRDYDINIHKIRITAEPGGFIKSIKLDPIGDVKPKIDSRTNTISFEPFLRIRHDSKEPLPLELEVGSMSMITWIKGLGEGSKLVFDFEYDDGHERILSLPSQEANVKIRPSDYSLLAAMFMGVIIGTGLKFYLEYLRQKGVINRRGVAVFVSITILVGIVITVIAWGGEIQIIAFKELKFTYDRPVVIFIIGLIGALGGVHYLNNWAKKFLPHDSSPPKETEHGKA